MTYKGHIVDVVRREIYDGELIVTDGRISRIRQCSLPDSMEPWPYLMPGFIDSHVHIESSMMLPAEFARVASEHGTIGAIADPHEIANVMGVEGVDVMIHLGRQAQFNFLFGAPSCVPSIGSNVETSGATLGSQEIAALMQRDDIAFLAEMMNFMGVLHGDSEVMAKLAAARAAGKPIDGHAPGLSLEGRRLYAQAGVSTDHECTTLEEGRDCIRAGMKVIIREGSAAKDYNQLHPLIDEYPDQVMLCTDDCHADDLVRGHINVIAARALLDGHDFWNVLQVACCNPQRHYGVNWGLLQEGDPATFIVVNNIGPYLAIQSTIIRGVEVYSYDQSFGSISIRRQTIADLNSYPNHFCATLITPEDIRLDIRRGDTKHIIRATDKSLYTGHEVVEVTGDPMKDSHYPWHEVQKVVVYNRYTPSARPVIGLVRGFGIRHGAIASSVAHDSHNIVAIGSDDELIVHAINRIITMRGGQVVITSDEMIEMALPIAGLMSPLDGHEVAYRCRLLCDMAVLTGCTLKAPFITMAFLCLPVIPELKITDRCLWDSQNMVPVT
ncbi:MAG TPA: adenine deaminase [Porphyromonadaceae bacterium]|nr:adenine deaminase [Porphyromonadaceae bacterium]